MKFSRIFRGSGQREWKIRGCIGEGVGDFLGNEERSVDDLGSSGNTVSNFFLMEIRRNFNFINVHLRSGC